MWYDDSIADDVNVGDSADNNFNTKDNNIGDTVTCATATATATEKLKIDSYNTNNNSTVDTNIADNIDIAGVATYNDDTADKIE